MGGVCPGCFRGSAQEDKAYYQRPQFAEEGPGAQPQQTSEEDRARSDEARGNAAIAAQKRAEAFEKSAGGKAAKKP